MSTSMTDFKVSQVLLPLDKVPVVSPQTIFKESIEKMGDYRLGILCIVENDGTLAGIITDGDIRRIILKTQKPFPALFADDSITHSNRCPLKISIDSNVLSATNLMEENEIWDLPVVDDANVLKGVLHLHPIVQHLMNSL